LRIGYQAAFPIVEVILKGTDMTAVEALRHWVLERVGSWLVGEDDEGFLQRLGRKLVEVGATVTVAESCTAGLLGAALTEVSGSSAWFERGYLTYANQAKIEELGVDAQILADEGAVSASVVCQMALGARHRSGCDFALAISGIAGPTGGTPDKPVGTVHFALSTEAGTYHLLKFLGRFDRPGIRKASVYTALAMLLWHLEGRLEAHEVHGPYGPDAFGPGQRLAP
jgi:nicotinamide-nucleotide amidase